LYQQNLDVYVKKNNIGLLNDCEGLPIVITNLKKI